MSDSFLTPGFDFPARRSVHAGEWVPLYLELQPGSGERLCIGVVAQDDRGCEIRPVEQLSDLACAFGRTAEALAWSAGIVIEEVRERIRSGGLDELSRWEHGIEGFVIGERHSGAGTDRSDLALLALTQVSLLSHLAVLNGQLRTALTEPIVAELVPTYGAVSGTHGPRVDSEVRRIVSSLRPHLRERFGQTYRISQSSRPLRFGYVGRSLVANFAALTATSPGATSSQVDKAKARLWDLKQLQSGVLADSLPLKPSAMSYELLVHRPIHTVSEAKNRDVPYFVSEAEEELLAEADKFEIRFRAFRTPNEIARSIIEREAV